MPVEHAPTAPPPVVTARGDRRGVTVSIHGELDAASAPTLRRELARFDPRGVEMRVDLSGATFLDRPALWVLADLAARSPAGRVALVNADRVQRRMIELAGLEGSFLHVGAPAGSSSPARRRQPQAGDATVVD